METRNTTTQRYSRDPQLQRVLEILEDGNPHKAGDIAFALGIHSRTVRRALHKLRDAEGFNIVAARTGFILEK